MNKLSLSYLTHQNQEWIDDPFELKGIKGFVTGVTKISDHQRNLNDYLQELVYSYGKHVGDNYELDLDKLSSPCQFELARLYIESIGREIEWACYGEDQTLNSDFLCAMLAMFKESNPKTREKFAQVTTVNVLKYYNQTLQDLLNIACQDLFCNEMHEAGYRADYDQEHGDVVRDKF